MVGRRSPVPRGGGLGAFIPRRHVALALASFLWFAAVAPVGAQPAGAPPPAQGPIILTADHVEYNTQTGEVVADGNAKAVRGDTTITADHLTGNLTTGLVHAMGHVVLTQPGRTATGEALTYNYKTRVGEMTRAVTTSRPWTATGRTFTTAEGQGVAYEATATPCDPAHPAFLVRARKVVVVPEDYLKAYDSILYVYGIPVAYVPVYTASLKKGAAAGGPSFGYNDFDGTWVQYEQFMPIGDWDNVFRIRYGTRSAWAPEDIISRHVADHLLLAHLGRIETFDQNGNQFNLDQYSVDIIYDAHQIGQYPVTYAVEGHAGTFYESQTNVSSFRTDAVLTLTSDTFRLGPAMTFAAAAYYRYNSYSIGLTRSVISGSAALTQILSSNSSTTLTYNAATVRGSTPFSFDSIGEGYTVALSFNYYPGGFLQSASIGASYDLVTLQTLGSLSVALALSPTLYLSANESYNVTLNQVTEIDYALNVRCDCVSLGVLYRTFPNAPANNQWFVTLGINTLPGTSTTVQVGGPR